MNNNKKDINYMEFKSTLQVFLEWQVKGEYK